MTQTTLQGLVDPKELAIAQLATMRASAVCVRSLIVEGKIDMALSVLDTWIAACTHGLERQGVVE